MLCLRLLSSCHSIPLWKRTLVPTPFRCPIYLLVFSLLFSIIIRTPTTHILRITLQFCAFGCSLSAVAASMQTSD
jgi:hypothetical protein